MTCILFPTLQINSAKTLVSSFLRNLTTAELCCWKTNPQPLFRVERKGISEIVTDHNISAHLHSFCELDLPLLEFDAKDTIIMMNSYALCLRNPDHLWPEDTEGVFVTKSPDILWMEDREQRLIDSIFAQSLSTEELDLYGHRSVSSPGIVAVRSGCVKKFLDVWIDVIEQGKDLDEAIREKAVWNKTLVMLAGEMTQKPFERGEVIPVREGEIDWDEVRNACIVSVSDWKDEKAKEHFLRCLYFGHFFGDETGLMLNILDP